MNTKLLRILSYAIFLVGVILGFALAIITIWSRLEATHYFFQGVKQAPFHGLRCPVLIAPTETAAVTAVFRNPTDQQDNFFYRAEISGRVAARQLEDQMLVPPHEARNIQVEVDKTDVDLLYFIFVKLNLLPNALRPSQEAVCGILVLDLLGLKGAQISALGLSLSFLSIAAGLGLWQRTSTNADRNLQRILQALGFLVISTLFVGSMGWWLVGMALSAITVLLIVISVRFALD